jgi:hypothetical protein
VFYFARSVRGDSFLTVLGIVPLLVRDQLSNILLINVGNHPAMAEVTLALATLAGQDVACVSAAALDTA